MISKIKEVAVIGGGTMGNGIAHVFALKGYKVLLVDINQQALEKAMATISKNMDRQIKKELITEEEKAESLARIQSYTTIREGVNNADLIIEAATENPEVKESIFKEIDHYCPFHAIIASNTSSISITKLAAITQRSKQVIGMHFMNPVPVMKLVEIIAGYDTSEEIKELVRDIAIDLGKEPVLVNDYPGFVSNRILMPMINEAIYTLFEGVAGVEEIDAIMKMGMAHPMGPLQLADFIGLDTCLAIMEVLHNGFGNPKYAPCPLLKNMVLAGHLGRKSGRGFYNYEG